MKYEMLERPRDEVQSDEVRDCDEITSRDFRSEFEHYRHDSRTRPLLLEGDALSVLSQFPSDSIDFAMTSPPYWGKREYSGGGIGLELSYEQYVRDLTDVFLALKRVLKPTGSFWLNIGDTYKGKRLLGIPWRVVFQLTDRQGWILRNSVIWNKVKSGMDNFKDRLGNVHENIFHFVK